MPHKNRNNRKQKNGKKEIKKISEQVVQNSESVVDDCPICCDEMNEPENNIRMEHCCKRTFHGACLRLWANEQKLMEHKGTCPMCRGEWPVEFVEQLFEGHEEEELIEAQYDCSCSENSPRGLLSPNILQGLSEEQKSGLRELIEMIEWQYQHNTSYPDPTQRLLIVFMMCPEDPLDIYTEESSADRQYEVMKKLLEWALDHIEEREPPTSHSNFALYPRPSNYDHFGPEPYLYELCQH